MPRLLSVRKKARVPATCCSKRRPRQPVEQVADGAVVGGDPAGRLAVGAGFDRQARRERGVVRDAERLDPAVGQQHRAVEQLHIDVMIGRRGRDLGLGRAAASRRTALRSSRRRRPASFPSARPARRRAMRSSASASERRADPVHLGRVGQAGADRVDMRVDQPGNDGAAGEIDHARRRTGQRADVGRASDRDDAIAAHRERFGRGGVERDDLAVEEDRVGGLRLRGAGEAGRQQAEPAASRDSMSTTAAAACSWSRCSSRSSRADCGARRSPACSRSCRRRRSMSSGRTSLLTWLR